MDFLNIIQSRYSCRNYNDKKISDKDLHLILEAGRLAPSSLGLEPWKFLVIKDSKKKEEISKIANNQQHVKNCNVLLAILARLDFVEYFEDKLKKRNLSQEEIEARIALYKDYLNKKDSQEKLFYAREQCHLAIANLINMATNLDIRSCIIGGMDNKKMDDYLGLNENLKSVVLVTLGYSNEEIPQKNRFSFDEVVSFI